MIVRMHQRLKTGENVPPCTIRVGQYNCLFLKQIPIRRDPIRLVVRTGVSVNFTLVAEPLILHVLVSAGINVGRSLECVADTKG